MSCEICGRGSCTRSFHSLAAQDEFDNPVTDADRIAELEAENAKLTEAQSVPMKYRRMEHNAQLQNENKELQAKLTEAEARLAEIYATEPVLYSRDAMTMRTVSLIPLPTPKKEPT